MCFVFIIFSLLFLLFCVLSVAWLIAPSADKWFFMIGVAFPAGWLVGEFASQAGIN
jgi:hypothetical protein